MRTFMLLVSTVMLTVAGASAQTAGESSGLFTSDGAWCWFQDPRAVYIDSPAPRTIALWETRTGRLIIGCYDHETGRAWTHELKDEWGVDDHNVGSILVLPDKRLLVFYARHNGIGLFARMSLEPGEIDRWGEEIVVAKTPRITYSHPAYLAAEKRYYVFWRGSSWKPTFATSEDGVNWSEPRILLQDRDRADTSIRPYTKITSDGQTTIHIAFTDGHPRNEPQNSIYYLRYEGGRFLRADGSFVGDMDNLPIPHSESDLVYDAAITGHRAWVWDIAEDSGGNPVIAYTRFPSETGHRYHYALWTGEKWYDTELVGGGSWFPSDSSGYGRIRDLLFCGYSPQS